MTSSNGAGEGHGAAVRRVEDPPLLRGTRPYTDDLKRPARCTPSSCAPAFAHAHDQRRSTRRGAGRARRRRRLHGRGPDLEPFADRRPAGRHAGGDAPPGAGHGHRALHRRAGRGRRRRDPRPGRRRRRARRRRLRAARRPGRHDQGARRRRAEAVRPSGNLAAAGPPGEDALADAEVRVGARFVNQRLAAVPMEPGAALAAPDPETGGFIL